MPSNRPTHGHIKQDSPVECDMELAVDHFKMTVDLGHNDESTVVWQPGSQEILVKRGDSPRELSFGFCERNGLGWEINEQLSSQIRESMILYFENRTPSTEPATMFTASLSGCEKPPRKKNKSRNALSRKKSTTKDYLKTTILTRSRKHLNSIDRS